MQLKDWHCVFCHICKPCFPGPAVLGLLELPTSFEGGECLPCGQAMIPFDDAELAYIAGLNAAADVDMLRSELPSLHEGCLRMLELGTLLLQMCARPPTL